MIDQTAAAVLRLARLGLVHLAEDAACPVDALARAALTLATYQQQLASAAKAATNPDAAPAPQEPNADG